MQNLCKGIFWVKSIDNFVTIVIKAKCDNNGIFEEKPAEEILSKSGDNYNHKKAWNILSKSETENKDFDYYPRGRVEIKRGKATIFANGNIADDRLLNWAVREFNLSKENGVNSVTIKTDMSNHYLCYLDEER